MQSSTEVTLQDIAHQFQKQLPQNIPANFPINTHFTQVTHEENIRTGLLALVEFMHLFYETLAQNSTQYEKPRTPSRIGKPASLAVDFPFLYHAKSVLLNIGYHSTLSDDALFFHGLKTLTPIICCEGMEATSKISLPKLMGIIHFLGDCGFYFEGLEANCLIEVTYPDNPNVLIGLKIMARAQRDLKWKTKDEVFLRCNFHALA
ncbi:MAG: hypothetical protein FWC16_11855 [Defluviitaleaceae bacterium]|nr:hypothetical protein [Defluviitaleaceae bacterium]MCL2275612.1 hypothetical protein [Defluviitaleaceae bacterium]